ncbi:MAG TPA: NAD-dependent epimerase/dehydratase family protein [Opitutaceae bacterium]|nr:NAD-dependent epimerase/dehydratase family protein [Opitutaceae bacterium]
MSPDAHGKNSPQRLVVFGAGYVGGHLAREAAKRGLEVVALTRNPTKAAALRTDGIEVVEGDLAETEWHAKMPGKVDLVLNSVSSGGGGIEGYRRSYVAGMKSVMIWVRQSQPGTLVYTGSTSVYPQDGGIRVDETAATAPLDERPALLREAEEIALAGAPSVRIFVLRLAGIYGPSRHHLLDQIRTGGPLAGAGERRLNLIHRDDICAAIWCSLTAPPAVAGGIFNVVDDAPARRKDIAAWLARRLGRPEPVFDVNLPGRRRAEMPDRIIENRKLRETLGWRPQYPSYREGYETLLSR